RPNRSRHALIPSHPPMPDPSTSLALRVSEVHEGESLDEFIGLTWRFNASDPRWIAPLRMSMHTALNRSKHPFHKHADVAYFIAYRGGAPVGRVAAIITHHHN